ncbi:TetR/AcrR family transcriptional regulator [Nocardioides pacificus]
MAVKEGQYRGVSAADRSADRRRRLLEAALEVWGSREGPAVTMTRVCAEAGLTERYFYEHFTNLDAALTAVMEGIADEIAERSVAVLESAEGGPTERIRAAISAFVEILTTDPRKGYVAMVASAALPSLRPRRNELLRQFAQLAALEAHELYGPSAWADQEGEMAGLMFIGGVAELVTTWLEGRLEASPADIVDAATHAFTATARR